MFVDESTTRQTCWLVYLKLLNKEQTKLMIDVLNLEFVKCEEQFRACWLYNVYLIYTKKVTLNVCSSGISRPDSTDIYYTN